MTPVLGLYQEKHGLIDPWFVPPAMAFGVRQILLPLQGSNWRKAKPRNEVKWRSRGGSLEDAPDYKLLTRVGTGTPKPPTTAAVRDGALISLRKSLLSIWQATALLVSGRER